MTFRTIGCLLASFVLLGCSAAPGVAPSSFSMASEHESGSYGALAVTPPQTPAAPYVDPGLEYRRVALESLKTGTIGRYTREASLVQARFAAFVKPATMTTFQAGVTAANATFLLEANAAIAAYVAGPLSTDRNKAIQDFHVAQVKLANAYAAVYKTFTQAYTTQTAKATWRK